MEFGLDLGNQGAFGKECNSNFGRPAAARFGCNR
jgi:hypothetical protein